MVAYYAHSQGSGHLNAARLFCSTIWNNTIIITSKLEAFGSKEKAAIINNEDTTPEEYIPALKNLPTYAHYLPKQNRKITLRSKQILDVCVDEDISLALVDVSVETAILFRIASVPYGYFLLPGNRNDSAHTMAFDAAEFCYTFLPEFMFKNFKNEILEKSFFLGFYSRFQFSKAHCIIEQKPILQGKKVLIICGNGGTKVSIDLVVKVKKELKDCIVTSVGNIKGIDAIDNHIGYTSDIENLIKQSDIIISSCGMNLTSEILALKNKFISIAEERHYDEQIYIQNALVAHHLSVRFDEKNIGGCIESYLKLQPPKDLEHWFMDETKANLFRNKIKSYETTGNFSNHHISQETATFA